MFWLLMVGLLGIWIGLCAMRMHTRRVPVDGIAEGLDQADWAEWIAPPGPMD
jgi:hypothetical protein